MKTYPTQKQPWYEEHFEILQKMLETIKNAKFEDIADIGCGTGGYLKKIFSSLTRKTSWPRVLRARDISPVALKMYKQAAQDIMTSDKERFSKLDLDFRQCDLEIAEQNEILPQEGNGDFVYLGWILPYLSQRTRERTLEAIRAYLHKGGLAFVIVHVRGYSIKRMLLRNKLQGIRDTIKVLLSGKMNLKEVVKDRKIVSIFEELSSTLPTPKEWEENFKKYDLVSLRRKEIFHDKGKPLAMIYLLQKK